MNEIQMNPNSSMMSYDEIQNLNQIWKETIAPNVNYAWEGTKNRSQHAETAKADYKLGDTIAKIKSLQLEGKSICLFIGRTPLECLPSDRNEAKENEIWVSADISFSPCNDTQFTPELIESSDLTQRLHLWLDFNEQENVKLIEGLFDTIVIDKSTVQFIKDDFAKRFSILFHDAESVLIFQDPSQSHLVTYDYKFLSGVFTFYTSDYSTQFHEPALNDYCYEVRFHMDRKNFATKETKAHLKEIFHHVEEHENQPFPYQTGYNNKEGKDHYFVVRHPKV